MIKPFLLRAAGFVIGCAIAAAGAPFVCLADTSETQVATEDITAPAGHWVDMGSYKLTFYCNCRRCCGKWAGGPTASGAMPAEGRTVACGALPLGTRIMIAGQGQEEPVDRFALGFV